LPPGETLSGLLCWTSFGACLLFPQETREGKGCKDPTPDAIECKPYNLILRRWGTNRVGTSFAPRPLGERGRGRGGAAPHRARAPAPRRQHLPGVAGGALPPSPPTPLRFTRVQPPGWAQLLFHNSRSKRNFVHGFFRLNRSLCPMAIGHRIGHHTVGI